MLKTSQPGSQSSLFSDQIRNAVAAHPSPSTGMISKINVYPVEGDGCNESIFKCRQLSFYINRSHFFPKLCLHHFIMPIHFEFGLDNMKTEMYVV